MQTLETDYLVVGAGAVGMAFVDTLLTESDADVVMVDRHALPGGHWNDAYPFVRLHQPSSFYGVPSRALGADLIDETGPNAGYHELASGPEVTSYFERVMRERFLPSGRVRYFPMHDYEGDGVFRGLLSGEASRATIRRRTVDATYFATSVPSTHARAYDVADGVACVPPNALPTRAASHRRFTVVGGGKTAMDAVVWLIEHGASPDAIAWIVPRDSWVINRATTQPTAHFFEPVIGGFADQLDAIIAASSVEDLFDRLEACGAMMRLDPAVRPTMFHYATLSAGELASLRMVRTIYRQGRVTRIEPTRIIFASGTEVRAEPDTLYVDCTATAVPFGSRQRPVFEDGLITLQSIRTPLVVFSASVIAWLEAHLDTDEARNRLAQPVTLADTPAEWLRSTLGNMMNQFQWSQHEALDRWIKANRLDPMARLIRGVDKTDPHVRAMFDRLRASMMPAAMSLQKLIAEQDAA